MIPNHPDSNPTAAPCVMVIFGASGDLTKRKLLPAICNLAQDNLLPQQFAIVGFATNDYTTESFRKMLGEEIPKYAPTPIDLKFWQGVAERIYYVRGDFQDPKAYQLLKDQIAQAEKEQDTQGNHLYYLAVARSPWTTSDRQLLNWRAQNDVLPYVRISAEDRRYLDAPRRRRRLSSRSSG